MMDLPFETHRGLIEPLSGCDHVKRIFLKRFYQFISNIRSSRKPILRTLLSSIQLDTLSTTGRNLRGMMLLTGKCSIDDVTFDDLRTFSYFTRPEDDYWKIEMLQHLLEERNFSILDDEDTAWLNFLASNQLPWHSSVDLPGCEECHGTSPLGGRGRGQHSCFILRPNTVNKLSSIINNTE